MNELLRNRTSLRLRFLLLMAGAVALFSVWGCVPATRRSLLLPRLLSPVRKSLLLQMKPAKACSTRPNRAIKKRLLAIFGAR